MKDQVLALLKSTQKPMKSGEIAEALSVDKAEVDKAIKTLKKEELIASPKACYYTSK